MYHGLLEQKNIPSEGVPEDLKGKTTKEITALHRRQEEIQECNTEDFNSTTPASLELHDLSLKEEGNHEGPNVLAAVNSAEFFGKSISPANQENRLQITLPSAPSVLPESALKNATISLLKAPSILSAFDPKNLQDRIEDLKKKIKKSQKEYDALESDFSKIIKTKEDPLVTEKEKFWNNQSGFYNLNPSQRSDAVMKWTLITRNQRAAKIRVEKEKLKEDEPSLQIVAVPAFYTQFEQNNAQNKLNKIINIENKLKNVHQEYKPLQTSMACLNNELDFFQKSIKAYEEAKQALSSLTASPEKVSLELNDLLSKKIQAHYNIAQDSEKAAGLDLKSDRFKDLEKKIDCQSEMLFCLNHEIKWLKPEGVFHLEAKAIQSLWREARKKCEYLIAAMEGDYFSTEQGQKELEKQRNQIASLKNTAILKARAAGLDQNINIIKANRIAFSEQGKMNFEMLEKMEEQKVALQQAKRNISIALSLDYKYLFAPKCINIATQLIQRISHANFILEHQDELLEIASVLQKIANLEHRIKSKGGNSMVLRIDRCALDEKIKQLDTWLKIPELNVVESRTWSSSNPTFSYSFDPVLAKGQEEIFQQIPLLRKELTAIYVNALPGDPKMTLFLSSLDVVNTALFSLASSIREADRHENINQASMLRKASNVLREFQESLTQTFIQCDYDACNNILNREEDYFEIANLFKEAGRAYFFGENDQAKELDAEGMQKLQELVAVLQNG